MFLKVFKSLKLCIYELQLTRTTVKAVQICDTSYQDFPLIEEDPENPKKLGERGYRGDYEDPEGIEAEPEQDIVYHPHPDEDVLDPGFSNPERNRKHKFEK